MTSPNLRDLFHARVNIDEGCWTWIGHRDRDGYGILSLRTSRTERRYIRAHRLAYELYVGPLKPGLVIDHLCRNTSCVNPQHLDQVSIAQNVLRGNGVTAVNARKTHCQHGHEYTPENTIFIQSGRNCRACKRMSDKARTEIRRLQGQKTGTGTKGRLTPRSTMRGGARPVPTTNNTAPVASPGRASATGANRRTV